MSPCNFWHFPKVKMTMTGTHSERVQDTEAATTALLKTLRGENNCLMERGHSVTYFSEQKRDSGTDYCQPQGSAQQDVIYIIFLTSWFAVGWEIRQPGFHLYMAPAAWSGVPYSIFLCSTVSLINVGIGAGDRPQQHSTCLVIARSCVRFPIPKLNK